MSNKPKSTSKRHKGSINIRSWRHYRFLTWLLCFIFPPLGALFRFGLGGDFFITLILTLLGWIPGQIYNFYIQNIRNNTSRERVPRFAIRYGLVDVDNYSQRQRRNNWSHRYINEDGMFEDTSPNLSPSSSKNFEAPFNTGSGPIESGNSSYFSNYYNTQSSTRSRRSNKSRRPSIFNKFKNRKSNKQPLNRWERTRMLHESVSIDNHLDSDNDDDGPEEPTRHDYINKNNNRNNHISNVDDLRHEF